MASYYWIAARNSSVEEMLEVLSLKASPPIAPTGNDGLYLVQLSGEWTVMCSSDGEESRLFKKGLILEKFRGFSALLIASESAPMAYLRLVTDSEEDFDLHAAPETPFDKLYFSPFHLDPPVGTEDLLEAVIEKVRTDGGIPYDAVVEFARRYIGFGGPYVPLPEGIQIIPVKAVRRRPKKA